MLPIGAGNNGQRSLPRAPADGEDRTVSLDFLAADPPILESIRAKLSAILTGDLGEAEFDVRSRIGGGNAKRYHLHMAAVDSRAASYVILVLDDVTETYALQRDKRLLTDQLMRSEERERGRIAREMHDLTVQDLVAIGLNLKRLRHLADDAVAQEVLAEVRTILTRTQEDVRTLELSASSALARRGRAGARPGFAHPRTVEPHAHFGRIRYRRLQRPLAAPRSRWRCIASRRKP